MLAGSKELECDHGITGVKVRVAVGANKASAVFSAAFIDQSWPGDQARRSISHMGLPISDSTPALPEIPHHNL
jgi:hypothetical protein